MRRKQPHKPRVGLESKQPSMPTVPIFIQNRFLSLLLRFLAAILTIAAVTLLLQAFKPELANQVIVLIYLLPVMLSTVLWGLGPGILAAFSGLFSLQLLLSRPTVYFAGACQSGLDLVDHIPDRRGGAGTVNRAGAPRRTSGAQPRVGSHPHVRINLGVGPFTGCPIRGAGAGGPDT